MTTATHTTAQDRLRQIAILISSVDAAAARQILLHLPTDKARQVRALVSQLGNVAPEEKRKILADFQRSAATSANSPASTAASSLRRNATVVHEPSSSSADAYFAGQPTSAADVFDSGDHSTPSGHTANINRADSASHSAWTGLNSAALVRFVRDERPAVTAVVISQLAPAVAVDVLQRLPPEISREVLLRLSRLQEIDPEAMQAIDEHLSQRLEEYQHHIQSELDNTRRIQSLLAAAPPALRNEWGALLGDPVTAVAAGTAVNDTAFNDTVQPHQSHSPYPSDTSDAPPPAAQVERTQPTDASDILPFPGAASERAAKKRVETKLIQFEFEQILQLPPTALAQLLSSTDSQTVLIALAGASPEFMKRFYRMLNRPDAKALESRLQRIGAIQLNDVDEAQRRIVENASRLEHARHGLESSTRPARRAA
ncbi:MAG: hypothetical protein IT422_10770 [Pirellulaceae bacterium]|jgi:flagellar motor switch protein FliG|nr:hypothetical protein [Pirellulaceae bacterium]